jgi:hypothetical protein
MKQITSKLNTPSKPITHSLLNINTNEQYYSDRPSSLHVLIVISLPPRPRRLLSLISVAVVAVDPSPIIRGIVALAQAIY